MEIVFRSLSSSPASLSALSHRRQRHAARRCSGPAAGQLQLRFRFTWHLHKPLEPHSPRVGAPSLRHAAQNRLAAATATPPWPEPAAAPRTAISRARASAPEKTLHSVSLALSLFPCLDTPERRRRSTERWRASSPPSSRASIAAPPKSTTPIALPRPRAALRPNSALRPPPEPPRRRSRAPPPPCSP